MKHVTGCFVRSGDRILLGMKKKGFGVGKYAGFGGKLELNETPEVAAVRELKEESGIVANSIRKCGELVFKWPHKPEWDMVSHFFVADDWSGSPVETNEMKPEWFPANNLPFQQMWADYPFWLPHVLAGRYVTGTFVYAPDNSLLEKDVKVK